MEYIISSNGRIIKVESESPLTIEELEENIIQHLMQEAETAKVRQKRRNTKITEEQYDLLASYAEERGISIGEGIEEMTKDLDIIKKLNR
jgi:3-dehydroquinate synthase class II